MLDNKYEEPPSRAILLEVFRVNVKDLHKRFIEYDTSYYDGDEKRGAYYKLPEGEALVLLLKSNDMLWTTIRRYTPEKHDYYLDARMEEFEIVRVDKNL